MRVLQVLKKAAAGSVRARLWSPAQRSISRVISGHAPITSSARYVKALEDFSKTQLLDMPGGKFLPIPVPFACMWGYSLHYAPLIYVRSCYEKILSLVWEHCETSPYASVIALGTPGIGKSGFVFLALWELLQKPGWKLIVLKFRLYHRFCLFWPDGKATMTVDVDEVGEILMGLMEEDGDAWYLADWKIDDHHYGLPCKFFVATSPDRNNYHHFNKKDDVVKLYIPTWCRKEIHILNDEVFRLPREVVNERFDKWGGVPRHVLSKSENKQRDLEDAVSSVARAVSAQSRLVVPDVDDLREGGYAYDIVYHIAVEDVETYGHASKRFATTYIEDRLASELNVEALDRVLNYEVASSRVESGLYSDFFNRKLHLLLLHGCNSRSAEMTGSGSFGNKSVEAAVRATKLRIVGNELPQDMTPDELDKTVVRPDDPNNADWDFIFGRRVVQLTVAEERKEKGLHPLGKRAGWSSAFEFLRQVYKDGGFELLFVVPLVRFSDFKVTIHEGINSAAKKKIMQDYKQANITVKKACYYVDGGQAHWGGLGKLRLAINI